MTAASLPAAAGSMVLHSLWIGAVIAAWTAFGLHLLRQAHPLARYRLALTALVLIAIVPAVLVPGRQTTQPWVSWIAAAWLAGAATSIIRLANSLRSVRRLRRSSSAVEGEWQAALDDCRRVLRIGTPVTLEESASIEVPCSVGIRRPAMIVPAGLLAQMSPDAFRALAAHELAHVARRDYAWNLVQVLLEGLLCHHPASWWLSRVIHRERERCCDELAGTACEPLELAEALASLEHRRAGASGRADISPQQPLLDRVHHLVAHRDAGTARADGRTWTAASLTATGAGLVLAAAWTIGLITPPPAAAWTPWLAAVSLGLLVGLRHAFEPDHLVAIATLVTRERSVRSALHLGAAWGIGHTAAIMVLGTILVAARRTLSDQVGVLLEAGVALMIAVMGVRAILDAWRMGGRGPVQAHRHGLMRHTHASSAEHVHIGGWALARRPLLVGVMHGLAGTGALTALAAASLPSLSAQIAFMLVFGLGSTAGMAAVAGLAGWPLARLVRTPSALAAVSSAAGAAAIVFAAVWGYPLLGGGAGGSGL